MQLDFNDRLQKEHTELVKMIISKHAIEKELEQLKATMKARLDTRPSLSETHFAQLVTVSPKVKKFNFQLDKQSNLNK